MVSLKRRLEKFVFGVKFASGLKSLRAEHGRLIEVEPETFDVTRELGPGLGGGRLDNESIGAEAVSPLDVVSLGGGGKNNDGQATKDWLAAKPLQDFQPGALGHFKIQDYQGGQRVFRAVRKVSLALEEVDCLLAVAGKEKRVQNFGVAKRAFEEKHVVLIILRE
jgi:hypothetical protein